MPEGNCEDTTIRNGGGFMHQEEGHCDTTHVDISKDIGRAKEVTDYENILTSDDEEEQSDRSKWELLERHIAAMRFDLSSVSTNMPHSIALHMLRAAEGGDGNSNPHYVTDTTTAINIARDSLLKSSSSSDCSAILMAIQSRKKAAIINVQSNRKYQDNAWDLWSVAARWPVLEETRLLELVSPQVEATQESIQGNIDLSRIPAARRLPVFTINNDVSKNGDYDESEYTQPMPTLDMLYASLSQPETKYFFTSDNFRLFDAIMSTRGGELDDEWEPFPIHYPHELDKDFEEQHNPLWWRKFQWSPKTATTAAKARAVMAAAKDEVEEMELKDKEQKNEASDADKIDRALEQLLEPPTPQLWMLSPGTALQARYSEGHIVRLQLSGTVRYTLFNADMLQHMYLYPSVDGRNMQSQVHMYRYDHTISIREEIMRIASSDRKSSFSGFYDAVLHCNPPKSKNKGSSANMEKYSLSPCMTFATLGPGQMLYVPPYWTVHAEALDADTKSDYFGDESIPNNHDQGNNVGGGIATVLDMHSLSDAQLLLAEAWHMRVPLVDALYGSDAVNSTISDAEKIITTQIYIVHILSRLVSGADAHDVPEKENSNPIKNMPPQMQLDRELRSPKYFAERLYQSRYEKLYPLKSVFVQRAKQEFSCYRPKVDGDEEADNSGMKNAATVRKVLAKLNTDLIASRAQFIADTLLDPELEKEPVGVRIIWLQNYVERLAQWAMGGAAERTGLFVLQCLHQEEMLHIEYEEEGPKVMILDPDSE
jgi:hypothetical protein